MMIAVADKMQLEEFWLNVRRGVSLFSPVASVDSPRLNANLIEKQLRSADLWLTPKVVAGFNESNFDFLPDTERKKLRQSVEHFRKIASQVPVDQPATQGQLNAAAAAFRAILEIMRLDKFEDPEAFIVGKQVEQGVAGKLPKWVRQLRFRTGADNTGDPGIWIWVIVDDNALQQDMLRKTIQQARAVLDEAVKELNTGYWPYIRFQSVSEQEGTKTVKKK